MQRLNRELLWTSILLLLCCSFLSACSRDTEPTSTSESAAEIQGTGSQGTGSQGTNGQGTNGHGTGTPESKPEPTDSPLSRIAADYQPPDEQGYVGSQACRECHAEISDSYAAHPMGQSIRPIDIAMERERLVDDIAVVSEEPRSYVVVIEKEQLVHHELITDSEGKLLFDTKAVMEYVIGSGAKAMAYIHRRDNLLFMSPLN